MYFPKKHLKFHKYSAFFYCTYTVVFSDDGTVTCQICAPNVNIYNCLSFVCVKLTMHIFDISLSVLQENHTELEQIVRRESCGNNSLVKSARTCSIIATDGSYIFTFCMNASKKKFKLAIYPVEH